MSTVKAVQHQVGNNATDSKNIVLTADVSTGDLVISKGVYDGTLTEISRIMNAGGGAQYVPAGTGAVATTVQTKLRESVSVLDFGAVGDGSTNDYAAIQTAINYWVANPVDLVFPSGKNFYVTTAIVATFSANSTYQKRITGYGARLTASAGVVNALTVTVSGAGTLVRNLVIEGLEITHAGTGAGLIMQGPLAGDSYLYGCIVRDLVIDAVIGIKLLGNFFESVVESCRIQAQSTGYGIYISTTGGSGSGSGGIVSSITLADNVTRGGINGIYGANDINDVSIYGGTYLIAQNEGIFLNQAQGGLIYGAHVEKVWLSAGSVIAANASIRVVTGGSYSVKDCTFAQSAGYSSECVRVFAAPNSTVHLNAGYVSGISTNYYLQGASSSTSACILYGEATYTNASGIAITHIKTLRTFSPIASKNTFTTSSPTTVTPSSDYGVYFCSITSNPTIAAPTFTPAYGDELEFLFEQAGGGGNTLTWNAVYLVGSFVPTAAYGKISSIRFKYSNTFVNGAKWVVVSTGTT
jgi:hypothetical protein